MKKIKHLAAISLGIVLFHQSPFAGNAGAAEQIFVELKDETSFGSGASISDDLYSPGGIKDVGLYVGNPNDQTRKDRVLLKYDITPFLLKADKIKSVELQLSIDYYGSPEPRQDLEVEHIADAVDVLNGRDLNRTDADSLGVIEISSDDAAHDAKTGDLRPPVEKSLDVTAAVKDDLASGLTSSVFRLKAPNIEAVPNAAASQGLTLTGDIGKRPILIITLVD